MMGYTVVALKEKIEEMFPEMSGHGVTLGVTYSEEIDAYIITFRKGEKRFSTHLEKKDADDCMNNIKCVALGVQIGQFISNGGSEP